MPKHLLTETSAKLAAFRWAPGLLSVLLKHPCFFTAGPRAGRPFVDVQWVQSVFLSARVASLYQLRVVLAAVSYCYIYYPDKYYMAYCLRLWWDFNSSWNLSTFERKWVVSLWLLIWDINSQCLHKTFEHSSFVYLLTPVYCVTVWRFFLSWASGFGLVLCL